MSASFEHRRSSPLPLILAGAAFALAGYTLWERLSWSPHAKSEPRLVTPRGSLAEFVYQLVGGLRSAMGYCGCATIEDLRTHARFVKVSPATVVENHPHDIVITKESPNYMPGKRD